MEQTLQQVNRLEELTQASLQILEHFHSGGAMQQQIETIRSALDDRQRSLAECRQDPSRLKAISGGLGGRLDDCEKLCAELERKQKADYEKQAGGNPERFEEKPLEDQLAAEEVYRDKIDYKSLVKLRENIGKMRDILSEAGAAWHESAEVPSLTAGLDEDTTGRLF